MDDLGVSMHKFCEELFPICRSITGDGVRKTLSMVRQHLPGLKIHEVPTGTECFDWVVPREWNIRDAYIIDPAGRKIVDFQKSNLHVLGYSIPVDKQVSLKELQEHLYSLPDQPSAIPYSTSYYKERWGFCISHQQRSSLSEGTYHVRIDSDLAPGSLTYGELILPGLEKKEIFLSTYTCHPSLANDNLSGPVVTTFLAKWLMGLKDRRYTYRIIFIPETIGAIIYLSRNMAAMKENIIAGFNLTCMGDDRAYAYLPSIQGDTLADKVARHVLKHAQPDHLTYTFLDRGSDERQYCSPGIDLPVCSIMRTAYGRFPEYHTSLDDLDLVTSSGLWGGYESHRRCLECLERNEVLKAAVLCEPQLSRRNMAQTVSSKTGLDRGRRDSINLMMYCDGRRSLLEVADLINVPLWELFPVIDNLKKTGLLSGREGL